MPIESATEDTTTPGQTIWRATPEALTPDDYTLLAEVDGALSKGIALVRYWEESDRNNSFGEKVALVNEDLSYGYFGTAEIEAAPLKVMGVCQENVLQVEDATEESLREFALHYFLRVASHQEARSVAPGFLNLPFPVTPPPPEVEGFRYTQHYYKLRDGGLGKFTPEQQSAVVDLRELTSTFEWVVLRIDLKSFELVWGPNGRTGTAVKIAWPLSIWAVISEDLIQDKPGDYKVGYATIRNPGPAVIAMLPGEFEVGFEMFHFRLKADKQVSARMSFGINQPEKIINIPYDPIQMTSELIRANSPELAKRFLDPLDQFLPGYLNTNGLDPVAAFIALANGLTLGAAGDVLGVTMDKLYREMMDEHYFQHRGVIQYLLNLFNDVPDWTVPEAQLPEIARTGIAPKP